MGKRTFRIEIFIEDCYTNCYVCFLLLFWSSGIYLHLTSSGWAPNSTAGDQTYVTPKKGVFEEVPYLGRVFGKSVSYSCLNSWLRGREFDTHRLNNIRIFAVFII